VCEINVIEANFANYMPGTHGLQVEAETGSGVYGSNAAEIEDDD